MDKWILIATICHYPGSFGISFLYFFPLFCNTEKMKSILFFFQYFYWTYCWKDKKLKGHHWQYIFKLSKYLEYRLPFSLLFLLFLGKNFHKSQTCMNFKYVCCVYKPRIGTGYTYKYHKLHYTCKLKYFRIFYDLWMKRDLCPS